MTDRDLCGAGTIQGLTMGRKLGRLVVVSFFLYCCMDNSVVCVRVHVHTFTCVHLDRPPQDPTSCQGIFVSFCFF